MNNCFYLSSGNCQSFFYVKEEEADFKPAYKANRNYKDSLFRRLFGNSPKDLLDLYNALNNSDYKNVEDLEITTLEDVIYMKMKNDVSFIIDKHMVLYEHQSTYSPNLPLRGFLYFAELYNKFINRKGREKLFAPAKFLIPTPKFVVFYNGTKDLSEDSIKIRLSDVFECRQNDNDFEWTALVLNINHGHNKDFMLKCRKLYEYSVFVSKVREYRETTDNIEEAIDLAVKYCIDNDILRSFLMEHRAEVFSVLTEFDEEKYKACMESLVEEERARADKAEARADKAEARADKAEAEIIRLTKLLNERH